MAFLAAIRSTAAPTTLAKFGITMFDIDAFHVLANATIREIMISRRAPNCSVAQTDKTQCIHRPCVFVDGIVAFVGKTDQ